MLRAILFFAFSSIAALASAQFVITEVTDSLLAGVNVKGVTTGSNGETIIFGGKEIFTFDEVATLKYVCNVCFRVEAVTAYEDTLYIADDFGDIYKQYADTIELINDYEANELIVASDGTLYGNNIGDGFFRWDGTSSKLWNEDNSALPANYVYDLAIDTNGLLWLATQDGLVSFNGTSFSHKSVPDDLSASFYNVEIDEDNAVWVSSAYGGIGRYANNNWTTYPETFGLLQLVQGLAVTHGNEVWTASFDDGLYRHKDENIEQFLPEDLGLSDLDNNRILFGDAQDRLWMDFDFLPLMYLTEEEASFAEFPDEIGLMSISPNPTAGRVTLSLPDGHSSITQIQVFSSDGKLCHSSTTSAAQSVMLDLGALQAGIYHVIALDQEGGRITGKVVIE